MPSAHGPVFLAAACRSSSTFCSLFNFCSSFHLAKVSGVLTLVRIDGETRSYGRTARTWWKATNLKTKREITIRSAMRLRARVR